MNFVEMVIWTNHRNSIGKTMCLKLTQRLNHTLIPTIIEKDTPGLLTPSKVQEGGYFQQVLWNTMLILDNPNRVRNTVVQSKFRILRNRSPFNRGVQFLELFPPFQIICRFDVFSTSNFYIHKLKTDTVRLEPSSLQDFELLYGKWQ